MYLEITPETPQKQRRIAGESVSRIVWAALQTNKLFGIKRT
jgi:hypothetical protein